MSNGDGLKFFLTNRTQFKKTQHNIYIMHKFD